MTNQETHIQYAKDEKTERVEFQMQGSFFKASKTDDQTYINAYNYKEKSMCNFIGNRQNLEAFIKGLQIILNDKKLEI